MWGFDSGLYLLCGVQHDLLPLDYYPIPPDCDDNTNAERKEENKAGCSEEWGKEMQGSAEQNELQEAEGEYEPYTKRFFIVDRLFVVDLSFYESGYEDQNPRQELDDTNRHL